MENRALLLTLAAGLTFVILRPSFSPGYTQDSEGNILIEDLPAPNVFDWAAEVVNDAVTSPQEILATDVYSMDDPNVLAFLQVIRYAEGTLDDGGYSRLFGGDQFYSFDDHPRQLVTRTFNNGKTVTSSAAGAYQFLRKTWDDVAAKLQLPDFSPDSQDLAAIELIRQRRALDDVKAGNFEAAIGKLNKVWASLPGSPYGQPTKTMAQLQQVFTEYGGTFA